MKNTIRIMEHVITRILLVPPPTLRKLLYVMTFLLDMESTINKKTKKNDENRVTKQSQSGQNVHDKRRKPK